MLVFHVFLQSRGSLGARVIATGLGAEVHVSMLLLLMS